MSPEKKGVYLDGNPSPKTISPSLDYDLLLQLSEGKNQTFQHILISEYTGGFSRFYIRHEPGVLAFASSWLDPRAVAVKAKGREYEALVDRINGWPKRDFLTKSDVTGIFLDFVSMAEGYPGGLRGIYGYNFGYKGFNGSNALEEALKYIGWEGER